MSKSLITNFLKSMFAAPGYDGDIVSAAIDTLKQEYPDFESRLRRALLIVQSDQEIFAKYSGCRTAGYFDEPAAMQRLVQDAWHNRDKGLKDSLRLQVDDVIREGRRYADRHDVEKAFKSYGLMIGLNI